MHHDFLSDADQNAGLDLWAFLLRDYHLHVVLNLFWAKGPSQAHLSAWVHQTGTDWRRAGYNPINNGFLDRSAGTPYTTSVIECDKRVFMRPGSVGRSPGERMPNNNANDGESNYLLPSLFSITS